MDKNKNGDEKNWVFNSSEIGEKIEASNADNGSIENTKVKKSKGVSPGIFAAGVVGAAAAGVAAGTIYSDEIRGIINSIEINPHEVDVSSSQEVPHENFENIESINSFNANADLELSANDGDGNVFSVSFIDVDGDGLLDSGTLDIQFVDGSSLTYTEVGDSITESFINGSDFASNSDYVSISSGEGINNNIYQIQPGDTLSEIAVNNNVSVENIMDLNPQITDPNNILAYDNIDLPVNDNIGNHFEGWADISSNDNYLAENNFHDVNISDNIENDNYQVENNEFGSEDWDSFNDNSEYRDLLSQTDFDSYESPDSYVDFSTDLGF